MGIAAAASVWTLALLCIDSFTYFRQSGLTHPRHISWTVERHKSDFLYRANYTFEVDGKEYKGSHLFDKPVFPNQIAAHMVMEHWQSQAWDVFYNPAKPSSCAMQKNFPLQKLVHFVLALGVFCYFGWLKNYATRSYA